MRIGILGSGLMGGKQINVSFIMRLSQKDNLLLF